ncbi:uncharacterized protein LOC112225308 isoform X1 [Oncorhynchus tshawytscha]|uniref:uncharacterized protein LOC112225308 isoform X1 n=1 Tax=Oncorhynchus tshawytscha TaxID=74940 RepID=UPI000D09C2B7|nr:uncharacterized protein LOC112225308 isoform X1 [Oncorhynchus tshawytscha]
MEFLKSYKEDLCKWLSTMDAEFIIDKCDDLLTAKQDKAIRNQKTDPGKISLLLETFIEMEESTCQDFLKILKDEQTHYPGLQQHFSKSTQASSSPKVYADCNSTVDTRKVTNVRGIKDLDMHVTVQAGSGNRSGMNVSQPPPHAEVVATKHSHIFASEISNCTIDGNLNMSVMQVPAPQASQCPVPPQQTEDVSSSQGPAMKMIIENKVKLIDWLRADSGFLLQHVHSKRIVTDREYQELKSLSVPEAAVTDLIDKIILKKEETCSQFLDTLKESEVNDTYPELKKWITTIF